LNAFGEPRQLATSHHSVPRAFMPVKYLSARDQSASQLGGDLVAFKRFLINVQSIEVIIRHDS